MALARRWLDICSAEHSCSSQEPSDGFRYPTRLIKISPTDSTDLEVRLCLPKEEEIEGAYCTLSHRWGSEPFLGLTEVSLAVFLKRIPFGALPKTFQDAIAVVFALGIRYVWIDSLCILQSGEGSQEDWLHESENMEKVYAHSYCNIGALSVNDSTEGMFKPRDPADVVLPMVDINWHGSYQRYTLVGSSFWEEDVVSQPLLQRAWVFQERMLTPRMLYFGRNQIYWECKESIANEGRPDVRHNSIQSMILRGTNTKQEMVNNPNAQLVWPKYVVEAYAGRGITLEADIFPALTGVCWWYAQGHDLSKNDYCAGIWLNEMPEALTWYVRPDNRLLEAHPSPSRPKAYRAPSWSWASLNRRVKHGDFRPRATSTILVAGVEASVQPCTSNPFGQIAMASLKLNGYLVMMRWEVIGGDRDPTNELRIFSRHGSIGRLYPDEYPSSEDSGDVLCLLFIGSMETESTGTHPVWQDRYTAGITVKQVEGGYMRTGYFQDLYTYFRTKHLVGDGKREIVLL